MNEAHMLSQNLHFPPACLKAHCEPSFIQKPLLEFLFYFSFIGHKALKGLLLTAVSSTPSSPG